MNRAICVFAQLMRHLPLSTFRRCVARYEYAIIGPSDGPPVHVRVLRVILTGG